MEDNKFDIYITTYQGGDQIDEKEINVILDDAGYAELGYLEADFIEKVKALDLKKKEEPR